MDPIARVTIKTMIILFATSLCAVAPAPLNALTCADDVSPDLEEGSFAYYRESPENAVLWRLESCANTVLFGCSLVSDDDTVTVDHSASTCASADPRDGGRGLVTYRPQRLLLPGRQYTLDCGSGGGPRIEVVDGLAMAPLTLEGIEARIRRDDHSPLCGEYDDYLEIAAEIDADASAFFTEGGRIDLYVRGEYLDTVTSERRLRYVWPIPEAPELELRVVASDGKTNAYLIDLVDLPRDRAYIPSCAVAPTGEARSSLLLLAIGLLARRLWGRR
ncbi:MAG: hypothetical protein KC486_16975 [Myxococcales bacterium]|nr:hypothetical protein [Myxococcales bacterium]